MSLLHRVFEAVEEMLPSKDAWAYWNAINRTILNADRAVASLWQEEKLAAVESVDTAKSEALAFLASERDRIMRLSREQAISEVLQWSNLANRIAAVNSVADNSLMEIGSKP